MSSEKVEQINYENWSVLSTDDKNAYDVILEAQECTISDLQLKCDGCNVCLHLFHCIDILMQKVCCKHIQ